MTNEDRQRTMDFIVQQQARMTVHLEKLEEERIRDRPRMVRLEESFKTLVELCNIHDIRLDAVESSTSALEGKTSGLKNAIQQLDRLVKKSQTRLDRLESRATPSDNTL